MPRPDIFAEAELDITGFEPRPPARPSDERVRAVSEAAGFRSREPRRYRTGRTAQFNVRTTPATVEAFYDIADRQGWKVGETLEKALEALQHDLSR
jgi:hypothetical protein